MEDLTASELGHIHLSLCTRERVIREKWIHSTNSTVEKNELLAEADELQRLAHKVCAAQLSKELGFYIRPVVPS